MRLRQTLAPTAEPVSLAQAKSHLRVDGTDEDALIGVLVRAARDRVEQFLGRQLVCATWDLRLSDFPSVIRLPMPPAIEIVSITYVDTAGTTQTLSSSVYSLSVGMEPAEIREAYGQSWPSVRGEPEDVVVTWRAGYATPFTASASTDVLTWSGRSPTDADVVRLSTTDNDLPAGLAIATDYYVRDSTGATCKLAASSGGAAVDITDAGTGAHFVGAVPEMFCAAMLLILGDLYEHREARSETKIEDNPTVTRLLWPHRLMPV